MKSMGCTFYFMFQTVLVISGCWMLADLNFQHQYTYLYCADNFPRRVWRCYRVKWTLGKLIISVTPLCKAIPWWLAQTYLEAVLYGFLTYVHILWVQALMPLFYTIFFKDVFIVNNLERHSVSLRAEGRFVCFQNIVSSSRAHVRQVCFRSFIKELGSQSLGSSAVTQTNCVPRST